MIKRSLYYCSEVFHSPIWSDYKKNLGVYKHKIRRDQIWYYYEGKGYNIWISEFHPVKSADSIYWQCDLELAKNSPNEAHVFLDEIMQAAIDTIKFMEASPPPLAKTDEVTAEVDAPVTDGEILLSLEEIEKDK